MSALKQRLARFGATAGVLAASTAAIFAVGGVSASSALAVAHCAGENIEGEGSSLQGTSQGIWTSNPLVSGKGFNGNSAGCVGGPTARYTVTSSGTGMREWGAVDGVLHKAADKYLGSDDGPDKGQLENMNTALGTQLSVVPVTQTAVAILANPPANCTITQIKNEALQLAFLQEAKITTWKEIGGTGTGCEVGIKRVVRTDASGTSYHLKHYLFELHPANVKCLPIVGETEATWNKLQNNTLTVEEEVSPGVNVKTTRNQVWPECTFSGIRNKVVRPASTGGGQVVKTVGETDGSIGYAALPDAEGSNLNATTTTILKVEDGEVAGVKKFVSPAASGETANCTGVAYTEPENLAETHKEAFSSTSSNLNWSKVYGTNPSVGGGLYPICTLTYDLAAVDSTTAFNANAAQTVKDFLGYEIASAGGQADIKGKWYQALPKGPAEAAAIAVAAIH
jgi:ABC-type phosphate transport system substrate-binding protein